MLPTLSPFGHLLLSLCECGGAIVRVLGGLSPFVVRICDRIGILELLNINSWLSLDPGHVLVVTHALGLLNVDEELLGMRADLGTGPGSDEPLYLFPVLSVDL